ncbi:MAG: small-conductance mechanosensitive channel [Candidatus Paceibacteria bacterium]|jgi:small conductance mechanosensitive channel
MNIAFTNILTALGLWAQEYALAVFGILFGTWILSHFMKSIITRIVRKSIRRGSFVSEIEEEKRENTLIKISHNFFKIFIWIAAALMILDQLGVPIGPLLTGAGILGVAVGFGSQSLVKDIITGLFIIAENQFRIGDFITVNDKYSGTVEDMTLRITKLRQIDGTIHYVPNGEVVVASNKSKDYSKVDLKIGVGYNTDLDHLEELINKVGEDIALDEKFAEHIIDPPYFLRIDDFGDYAINIHISGKVQPKKQYLINGEMRRRLKNIFDENDIEIPYPTRVSINK